MVLGGGQVIIGWW